jgi:histidyl-tRNA synthetase
MKAPRGTRDVLPGETEKWQKIEKIARRIFSLYNYREIRTPIFEDTSLFERSIGANTDIVEKEMYTFLDKKGRSLTLRPEGTAPVVRAYLEHKLYSRGGLEKFFYIGPFFRYERPQAGRNRQFNQVGVEAIGSDNPALDAEVIRLSLDFLNSLGLKTLQVSLNSIGCSACQPVYRKGLQEFLEKHLEEFCNDCRERARRNPLRVLDCKREKCIVLVEDAPATLDFLCPSCEAHFETVRRYLDALGTIYELSPRLVRGLDYYTKTTFEIVHSGLGAQNAVAGGGRFDRLVEEFGGKPTPAVGFAAGVDRIALIMGRGEEESARGGDAPIVYIATAGREYLEECMLLLNDLRSSGVSAEMDYDGRSLKSQFRVADKLGVRFAIILGQEGLILRDMRKGEQKEVKREEIIDGVKSCIIT